MDKDLVVAIRVGSTEQQSKIVGTGYPVAPDRILTANHLFKKNPGQIWVQWRWPFSNSEGKDAKQAKYILAATHIWPKKNFEDGVGAAVLKTDFPKEAKSKSYGQISDHKPHPQGKWEGAGYAEVSDDTVFDIDGTLSTIDDIDDVLNLTSRQMIKDNPGKTGLSGAPVFTDGRIFGIISKAITGSENVYEAIKLWNLLNDDSFKKCIGYEGGDFYKKRNENFKQIVNYLRAMPSFCSKFKEYKNINLNSEEKFAHFLLEMDIKSFLSAICVVCRKWDENKWPEDVSKDKISEIVFLVAPLIFGENIEIYIKHQKNGNYGSVISSAGTLAGAEIGMSRFDGRKPHFGASVVPDKLPWAEFAIPVGGALPANVEDIRKSWISDIKTEMYKRANLEESKSVKAVKDRKVRAFLEEESKRGSSRYLVLNATGNMEDNRILEIIKCILSDFRHLFVVPIDENQFESDLEDCLDRDFAYFVHLATKGAK